MSVPCVAILLSIVAGFPLVAADVSGHWSFDGDVAGNPVKLECDFHQDGARLEGACTSNTGEIKVAGEVSDPKVRFSYAVDYQGATYTLYYTGTLETDAELKGEILVGGTTGTFTAKKSGRKKPN